MYCVSERSRYDRQAGRQTDRQLSHVGFVVPLVGVAGRTVYGSPTTHIQLVGAPRYARSADPHQASQ